MENSEYNENIISRGLKKSVRSLGGLEGLQDKKKKYFPSE